MLFPCCGQWTLFWTSYLQTFGAKGVLARKNLVWLVQLDGSICLQFCFQIINMTKEYLFCTSKNTIKNVVYLLQTDGALEKVRKVHVNSRPHIALRIWSGEKCHRSISCHGAMVSTSLGFPSIFLRSIHTRQKDFEVSSHPNDYSSCNNWNIRKLWFRENHACWAYLCWFLGDEG